KKTKGLFQLFHKENLFTEIEWVKADITDIPALEKAFESVEYVYHCAAYVSLSSSDEKMRKINIEGTANIANLCIDFKITKLCYVSYVSVLRYPFMYVLTEVSIWIPFRSTCEYANTKYGGEFKVFRVAQEGVDLVVVNSGNILGLGFPTKG